jgi:hypothetical protein
MRLEIERAGATSSLETWALLRRGPGGTKACARALERGEKEPGAGVLLAISQEFGKSVDWVADGKEICRAKEAGSRRSVTTWIGTPRIAIHRKWADRNSGSYFFRRIAVRR